MITLQTLLEALSRLAINQKIVNYACAGTSLSAFNNLDVKDYPVLFIQPQGQNVWTDNNTQYSINLIYIDRLTEDSENDINIYSTAIEEIKHFIQKIKIQDWCVSVDDTVYIENFVETEGKSDRCAGAVARIKITVVNEGTCYVE